MKKARYIVIVFLLFAKANAFSRVDETSSNEIIKKLITVKHRYDLLIDYKNYQLQQVNKVLKEAVSTQQKVDLLIEKDILKTDIIEMMK